MTFFFSFFFFFKKTNLLLLETFCIRKHSHRLKSNPAFLVLILMMGVIFSSNVFVLAMSGIFGAMAIYFVPEASASVSERRFVYLMEARKGTNQFAIQYTKKETT